MPQQLIDYCLTLSRDLEVTRTKYRMLYDQPPTEKVLEGCLGNPNYRYAWRCAPVTVCVPHCNSRIGSDIKQAIV